MPPTARRIGGAPVIWISGKFGRGGADSHAASISIATIGERRRSTFIAQGSSQAPGVGAARLACSALCVHQGMNRRGVKAIMRAAELAGHLHIALTGREPREVVCRQ